MAAKSIRYIEQQLRLGKTPEALGGKRIGAGVCKAAYLFNDSFVVKENKQDGFRGTPSKLPPKWIEAFGARAPRTYKVGAYIIQEYVTVLAEMPNWSSSEVGKQWRKMYNARHNQDSGIDVHEYNCGVSKNGQLVVFDW